MKKINKSKKVIIICMIVLIIILIIIMKLLSNKVKKINNENQKEIETTTKFIEERKNIMDNITLNYHASIKIEKNGKIIYIDPYKIDNNLKDADYIFITHSHYDHYSEEDIKKIMNDNTKFIVTRDLESKVKNYSSNILSVMPNNNYNIDDISFDTVPAYNINKNFHPKDNNWVGYNINIDNTKYYIVGDSDVTDEVKKVKCDVIFIPVGGTYTMTDKEASELVNSMNVKYAVPIHFGVVGSINNANNFVSNLNNKEVGIILK